MSRKRLAIDWKVSMAAFITSIKTIETCHYPESHAITKGTNTDKYQKSFQFYEEAVRNPIRSKAIQCKNSTLSIEIGKKYRRFSFISKV